MKSVKSHIRNKKDVKGGGLVLLLDPDECRKDERLEEKLGTLAEGGVELIFLGGSLLVGDAFDRTLARVQRHTELPLVTFPGSPMQLCNGADATLFLSLISGRNPELLIGQQVLAAPHLKRMETEVISTGYMLIDGGRPTTASYMSGSHPIPRDKEDIAMATAQAGEMLGMSCIYMDAGSGAEEPIPPRMIEQVAQNIEAPLIVGGGISSGDKFRSAIEAGADLVVVGSAFERDPGFLEEIGAVNREFQ